MAPHYSFELTKEQAEGFRRLGFNPIETQAQVTTQKDGFEYIPKIGLYVAKERSLHGAVWIEANQELQKNGQRMLTIPEFKEVLKYFKENDEEVYRDITEVRSPWRAEWLNARFQKKGKNLYVNQFGSEETSKLSRTTLMKHKLPGISLEYWLSSKTTQGLPTENNGDGNLYYWHPIVGSVAGFGAGAGGIVLNCEGSPLESYSNRGVRAAKAA